MGSGGVRRCTEAETPRARAAARRTSSAPAAGSRCTAMPTARRSISPSSAPARAAAPSPASSPKPAFRWSRSRPGPFWRPLEDFASDEKCAGRPLLDRRSHHRRRRSDRARQQQLRSRRRRHHRPLYDDRASAGGPNGSSARSQLGYARDWPISFDELEPYYEEAEEALKMAGPVRYPWSRRRKRYPYREHEVNALGPRPRPRLREARHQMVAAPARHALGAARHGASLRLSRLLRLWLLDQRQAERARHLHPARDQGWRRNPRPAMVGRIEMKDGRATGLLYHREGRWRRQKARHVVVAGYAIETPRLLLNSACPDFPDGLANDDGSRRHAPHVPLGARRLGLSRRGDQELQGAALHGRHRALELRRQR